MIWLRKLGISGLDFVSNLTSLCCHALCTTLFQSTISPSFKLPIAICLNHWIHDFLRFKFICGMLQVVPILNLIWHHCTTMDLKTRTSKILSSFLGHHRWIQKNWNNYNNKNSYAPIKELTTHQLKIKYFYNQIKIYIPYEIYNPM